MTVSARHNAFALRIAKKMLGGTPDTCSIQRLTQSDDNAGGWSETNASPVTGIPCRFSDSAGMEELVAGAQQGFLNGVIYLPATLNGSAIGLTVKDRVVVAARGLEPARTFEVIGFGPGEGVLISAMVKIAQS